MCVFNEDGSIKCPLAAHAVRNAEGKYEWRDPPLAAPSPVTNDGGAQSLAIAPGAPGLSAPPLPAPTHPAPPGPLPPPPLAPDAPTSPNAPPLRVKAPPPALKVSPEAPPAVALVATPHASQAPQMLQFPPYWLREDGNGIRMTGNTDPGFGMPPMTPEEMLYRTFYQQMHMGRNIPQHIALPALMEQVQEQLAFPAQMPNSVPGPFTQEQIEQIANVFRREQQGE